MAREGDECSHCGVVLSKKNTYKVGGNHGHRVGYIKPQCSDCDSERIREWKWWNTRRVKVSLEAMTKGIATSLTMVKETNTRPQGFGKEFGIDEEINGQEYVLHVY